MPRIRQLSDPMSTAALFSALARKAQSIRIATAWGSTNVPVTSSLEEAQAIGKLEIVVGWDFEGTHPGFLTKFRESLRVVPRTPQTTFHPKVYLFTAGKNFDAIVGSSNLTHGGFSNNVELNLHVRGATSESLFRDLNSYIQRQWDSAREISEDDIEDYRHRWQRARSVLKKSVPPLPSSPVSKSKPQIVVDPRIDLDWAGFVGELRKVDGTIHYVFHRPDRQSYLDVIADIQTCFARRRTLLAMTRQERSDVGGTNTHSRFGHFGTTHSVGSFTHAILESPAPIDQALNHIPLNGSTRPIKREFDAFFVEFDRFATSLPNPRPSMGCATRLLAMKRPDSFICANGKNRGGLSRAFGFSEEELRRPSGYWKLCEHIWSLPWYSSPKPATGEERDVWTARAALVDAFYTEA